MIQAKKSLGQNFLCDADVVQKILVALSPRKNEIIVEAGAGQGVLTEGLALSGAIVIAVETDDRLIPFLKRKFLNFPNVFILHGDILSKNTREVLFHHIPEKSSYTFAGNLPYFLASPIIRTFLEEAFPPREMFCMVQKEVAERIAAEPGKMSVLGVSVQYYADPEILFTVSKEAFDPSPKVESAFIRIRLLPRTRENQDRDRRKIFFRLVKLGFSSRRKTLCNNLASGLVLDKEIIRKILFEIHIPEQARAQDLSVDDWKRLSLLISERFENFRNKDKSVENNGNKKR